MALTKEDLQAIQALVQAETNPIKKQLDEMQVSQEEVRGSTNALIAWADNVSVITQVKFPVQKAK